MSEIYDKLTSKPEEDVCKYFNMVNSQSAETDMYYKYINEFLSLLDSKNAYHRMRGFVLICAQARWDTDKFIEKNLDRMLKLLNDPKPIVVRICLGALHELVLYQTYLEDRIKEAVLNINYGNYKDSMSPLIKKDADELLKLIG